ncbi:C25 family cysteine peptidase [Bacteroidota bacterium]
MKNLKGCLLIILSLISLFAVAQTQTFTYKFSEPNITNNPDGTSYLMIPDCNNFGEEGNPYLPYYGADILIPQGKEVKDIKIINIVYGNTIKKIKIQPAAGQFPISKGAPDGYKVIRNKDIYKSKNVFPVDAVENISTQFLAGHSIATFTICPVQYYPALNKVEWIKEISIEIISTPGPKAENARKFLNDSQRTISRLNRITDNPEMIFNYSYTDNPTYPEYDILFISNQAFISNFEDYIYFKESTGFAIKSITVEDIYATYTGQDNQEKIRNCIIDYYTNWGIMSVILGGDADPNNSSNLIVPHRGFWGATDNDYDVPADMYYSCLDGTWNDDNDNKWAEPGEEDLFEEVSIGRLCVDSQTEANNMINKLIMYQNEPVVADIEKSLMMGESLDSFTWGGDSKDEVADGSSTYGYTTAGVSSNFNVERMYERDGWWNKSDVFNEFNNAGINLLNHLGHSNVSYNMKMSNSDITTSNFTNDGVNRGYVIGYSQGCYNGSFDNRGTSGGYGGDCFAEKITTISTAEVATVANSRYGLYSPGNTNGASQYFDREFYDAIFGENLTMIGDANGDSKSDNAGLISQNGGLRWCCYELNVFGDPTMDIWTAIPTDILAAYPLSLPMGATQITVTSDAPFCRVGIMQDSILVGRAIADANGIAVLTFFNPISSPGELNVSLICHNRNRHEGTISILENQPYVAYNSHTINDPTGNNNNLPDYGETMFLSMEMINMGDQDAHNVTVTIRSNDPHVIITDSTEYYGDLAIGQSVNISDGFEILLSDSIPNNYMLIFTVKADGEDNWFSNFYISACSPAFTFNGCTIDDNATGNGNGILDPGETASMIVNIVNSGLSMASNIENNISTSEQYISIIDSEFTIDILQAGEQGEAHFTIAADPLATVGTAQIINCYASAGAYTGEDDLAIKTGVICEDWETGDLSRYNWLTSGGDEWSVESANPFEGTYSVKSGNLGNVATSYLRITLNVMVDDSLSFYRKVSSEENNDFLKFYINTSLLGDWSGELDWEKFTYAVPAGVHTFKWAYTKNGSGSAGEDAAWLDNIFLPQISLASANAGVDQEICAPDNCLLNGEANNYNSIHWTTSGTGSFSSSGILDPEYFPSLYDVNNGSVVLTLGATNTESGTVFDDMILTFEDGPLAPDAPVGPEYVNVYTNPQSSYTTNAVSGVSNYIWELQPSTAGVITGNGTDADVVWSNTYTGEVKVKVSSEGDLCNSLFSVLNVNIDYAIGIQELDDLKLSIYPNPGSGLFNIKLINTTSKNLQLKVYDLLGEPVYQSNIDTKGGVIKTLDLSHLTDGIYIISLQNEDVVVNRRIVIK